MTTSRMSVSTRLALSFGLAGLACPLTAAFDAAAAGPLSGRALIAAKVQPS